jgi:hypothetical protein
MPQASVNDVTVLPVTDREVAGMTCRFGLTPIDYG